MVSADEKLYERDNYRSVAGKNEQYSCKRRTDSNQSHVFQCNFRWKKTGTCEMKTYGILPFFHLHGICMYLHCLYVQKRSQITRRHEDSYDSFAP